MVIVLPDGPLAPVESRLGRDGLARLLTGLAPHQVTLALPKFRVTSQFSLAPTLTALGMPLAFTSRADFTGITTAEPLHISNVVHQAYLDVDEQGTEAAAATAVVIRAAARVMMPDPPVEMTVDRPFLFAITELAGGRTLASAGSPTLVWGRPDCETGGMRPDGLHHVSLNVGNIPAALDFYTRVLGLTERTAGRTSASAAPGSTLAASRSTSSRRTCRHPWASISRWPFPTSTRW